MIRACVSSTSLQRFHPRAYRALAACALMPAIAMLAHSSVAAQDKKPPFTPGEARLYLRSTSDALLEKQREQSKTFEAFRKSVTKEPFPNGKYIVNGDTPVRTLKELKDFYEQNIVSRAIGVQPEFAVMQKNGVDIIWNAKQKKELTYCVSSAGAASGGFGDRYQTVVAAMADATKAWEQAADIKFVHLTAEDAKCKPSSKTVFDVRPVSLGRYLARAFFPNEPRASSNLLIDDSSFDLPAGGKLSLTGILRHELGHILGARHEHTRAEAGTCFEDNNWRGVTDYDAMSVMHYPQCGGKGDWSLALTDQDKIGIACLYKATGGVAIDPNKCKK